jgi:hypothetical protein
MVRARLGGKRRWDGAGRRAKTRSGCHRSLVASSVLALTPLLAGAQQPGPASPTVDLALSGGSAKGIAHIGVHVDVVAGTSMGAVVGGLYRRLDRERHRRGRVAGAIVGSNVMRVLEHVTWRAATVRRFTDLPRPFVAVATDLETGGERGPAVLRRTGRRRPRRAAAGVSVERRPLPS